MAAPCMHDPVRAVLHVCMHLHPQHRVGGVHTLQIVLRHNLAVAMRHKQQADDILSTASTTTKNGFFVFVLKYLRSNLSVSDSQVVFVLWHLGEAQRQLG